MFRKINFLLVPIYLKYRSVKKRIHSGANINLKKNDENYVILKKIYLKLFVKAILTPLFYCPRRQ